MRVIFAGTPEFAALALDALIASRHRVTLVLTRPDRPAGRGKRLQTSPVKRLAIKAGVPIAQPQTLRDREVQTMLAHENADVMVVAAYGLILPAAVLTIPRLGCVNIHASLLPRWRGAAPIQRAIEAGDTRTGVTIMQMDEGLDTGPTLLAQEVPIQPDDSAATLHDRLAALGARLIVGALDALEAETLEATPQPELGACYARKIDKSESPIDWHASARTIVDRVRAFDPFPGCSVRLGESAETLKVWKAVEVDAPMVGDSRPSPGTVLAVDDRGVCVACGQGVIALRELQRPGGRRLRFDVFVTGTPLNPGQRFVPADPASGSACA